MATDWRDEGQDGGTYGSAAAAEGWRRGAAGRAHVVENADRSVAVGRYRELLYELVAA